MIVEKIWTANAYRNFNYLIVCPESGEALAIDPLDHQQCLDIANKNQWDITQILNTHEHWDHIGGNENIVNATSAKIIAHKNAKDQIPNIDKGVNHGDIIKVGRSIELECLDTPGHTMSHICMLSHTEIPALFSGDTLFNAGAGNCHNGGDPKKLYKTFTEQLNRLPIETQIYPGHDYLTNNLKFTLDREPENQTALKMLNKHKDEDPTKVVTTLKDEMSFNTFFRLQSPGVINKLRESFSNLEINPSPEVVFLKLRELRNHW